MPFAKCLSEKETPGARNPRAPPTCGPGDSGTKRVRCVNRKRTWGIDEMNEKLLSELSARLSQMAGAHPAQDFERNVRALLASAFARLDLVSREEYDVQAQVLARARERLAALEARVAELERARGSTASD